MTLFNPKRILCPVDFSETSASALRAAALVARPFDAEVMVLHAQSFETPLYFTAAQTRTLETQLRKSAKAARAYLHEYAARQLPMDTRWTSVLAEGDPVTVILREIQNSKIDLVAMGTHGRTGLSRVRLGSVMESVLRQAEIPVLTAGPRMHSAAVPGTLKRILYLVDLKDTVRPGLAHATSLAEKTGAEIVLLHVARPGPPEPASQIALACRPATLRFVCAFEEGGATRPDRTRDRRLGPGEPKAGRPGKGRRRRNRPSRHVRCCRSGRGALADDRRARPGDSPADNRLRRHRATAGRPLAWYDLADEPRCGQVEPGTRPSPA